MRRMLLSLSILLLVAMSAVVIMAQDDMPSGADLAMDEWVLIEPGGDTICSQGTPYHFYTRMSSAETDNLMVYFEGGGACWFDQICDLEATPQYVPFLQEEFPSTDGIFDFENDMNPFADYNMVYVPYCTGDVHLGDVDATYSNADGEEFTIYHRGYTNATTVLDWTFANVMNPETVFVTGSSAGSIPAPFYAEMITEAYPDARIEVLGDAAGGYRIPTGAAATFGQWNTMSILTDLYADYDLETIDFEAFYVEVGKAYPDISMTQYNTAFDETQVGFLFLNGVIGTPLPELLNANFADIEAETEFAHFLAGGDLHVILPRPEFYTYAVGEQSFVDWITALANGEEVETVTCGDADSCEVAETVE